MRLYVETNFVLEMVLGQEQVGACERILSAMEIGAVELVLPAFSVMEPYRRLAARAHDRKNLTAGLGKERAEIARIDLDRDKVGEFEQISGFLVAASQRDASRMAEVRSRLLSVARILPLDGPTLLAASAEAASLGLSEEDAVVLASIRADLGASPTRNALFLTKDKDFRDPQIALALLALGCETMFNFEDAYSRMEGALGHSGGR